MGHSINRKLGHIEVIKIADFIRKNKKRIQEERPDYQALENMVKEETGVDANPQSVKRLCKELGVEWFSSRQTARASNIANCDIHVLATRVSELFLQRNQDVPDDIMEILTRNNQPDTNGFAK